MKGSSAALCVCLLLALLMGGTAVSAVPATADHASVFGPAEVEDEVDLDDVILSIEVESGGDAVWTIEYRTRLDSEDEEAAFDDLRADVEEDPDAYLDPFGDRMDATAADASEFTDREMVVSEFGIDAERVELPREYGIVRYTFRWSNFAAVDGDRLVIGDAIDGLFLDDASELRIAWDGEYGLIEATPEPTETGETSVSWRGPTTFSEGEPRVTLDPAAVDDGTDPADPGPIASDHILSATTLAFLGVILLAVALGYGLASGRLTVPGRETTDRGDDPVGVSPEEDGTAVEIDADGTATDAAGRSTESAGSTHTENTTNSTEITDTTDTTDTEGSEDPPESKEPSNADGSSEPTESDPFAGVDRELLSNEEQVMRLIEAHGGRMKQKQVAAELDWTAAKTSQVTKRLREEGDLVGFRLGRENVLTLPEEDPR
ncbi:helix-turn-helix transcriptional regulator [Halorubrum vacuolatum]|uniref:IclR helix-turn-helix domain-containing protein n=1 Tax=Halorubrum vacuolatum TaxID=63740 RepID=A0A238UNL7_HALVU|nr:hypothetical protein [Halorubrum vacuolatum]SNR22889.1 hypothetical protein SAMN06264855_10125 [Halorubrum vacuolatum]